MPNQKDTLLSGGKLFEHLLDLNKPLAEGNPAPDVVPVVEAGDLKNTSGLAGGWAQTNAMGEPVKVVLGDEHGATVVREATPDEIQSGRLSLYKSGKGTYLLRVNVEPDTPNAGRFEFLRNDQMIDVSTGSKNFVTKTHAELEALVGHPLMIGPQGKPVLSDHDCEIVGAGLAIQHMIERNPELTPRVRQSILHELSRLRRKDSKRILKGETANADRHIHEGQVQRAILDEMSVWLTQPLVLQKPDGSAFHKFQEAGLANEVYLALRRPEDSNPDPTLPRDLATTLGPVQSFVVEHDWAGIVSKAETIGDGAGEVSMPYSITCFEFVVSGKRVLAVFTEDPEGVGPLRLVINVRFDAGWAILMTYTITDAWLAEPGVPSLEPAILGAMQPLADLVTTNAKAIGILLETQIVEREVVRIDAKLNKAREKRGKLPLYDYHVVALSRRERAKPRPLSELDPDREITRKRWHLVRSHWRQYASHRTKVPWHSRGDIDLGIVDKHYKL